MVGSGSHSSPELQAGPTAPHTPARQREVYLSLSYTECPRAMKNQDTWEQTAEADPERTQMVELPPRDFKITLINALKDLVEKGDNMCEHMGQKD